MSETSMLRIKDWNTHFENHKTRIMKRLDWVPIPNRMDGLGYIKLLDHAEGAAHFGAWVALIELASKCEPRGTLSRGGSQLGVDALSILTRIPERIFRDAIPRLVKIGWMEGEIEQIPAESGGQVPESGARLPDFQPSPVTATKDNHMAFAGARVPESGGQVPDEGRRKKEEKERREGKEGKEGKPDSPLFDFDGSFERVWNLYPEKGRTKRSDAETLWVDFLMPLQDEQRAKEVTSICAAVSPGGRWFESEQWADKEMVFGMCDMIRNRRWKESPLRSKKHRSSDPPRKEFRLPPEVEARLKDV